MKNNRLFSEILGITLISACVFFLLLFVGIALEFGLFTAWLYAMPLCLGIFVGLQFARGRSLTIAVKAWLNVLVVTLFPFVAFIIVLPTAYQILSITLITLGLGLGLHFYRRHRRVRIRNLDST